MKWPMTDDDIIDDIIRREGDYVDRPEDKGGPTRWGITIETLAGWEKRPVTPFEVKALPKETAHQIYSQRYLIDTGIWKIPGPEVRGMVLDAAVNHGPSAAIKMLQRAIGVLDDGIIGNVTLAAIPHLNEWKVVAKYAGLRCRLYGKIILADPSQRVFSAGWLMRMADILERT